MSEILPGAEPFRSEGGPVGTLVLHGFTGTPQSMRPLAEAFAGAGHAVEMPLLPGHGTTVDDMMDTGWDDWAAAAEAALVDLQARTGTVVVAGLSMGGSLTCWLASRHPELAGIICVNPAVRPDPGMVDLVRSMVVAGSDRMDAIGGDIADPEAVEVAYSQTPLPPLLTMFDAAAALADDLARIEVPLLLMTSPEDHVVPAADSDVLAAAVSGPVERVSLDRSYHVATLDHDRDLICRSALDFVARVTAGAS